MGGRKKYIKMFCSFTEPFSHVIMKEVDCLSQLRSFPAYTCHVSNKMSTDVVWDHRP